MLDKIKSELRRLDAANTNVSLDDDFEPAVGTLLKVEIDGAHWHLQPPEFLELLEQLPAGAGSDEIRQMIEAKATTVWHGPSPKDSRDTSK